MDITTQDKLQQLIETTTELAPQVSSYGPKVPFQIVKTTDKQFQIPNPFIEGAQPVPVKAVRGMILNWSHYLSMYDGLEKKNVCRTISSKFGSGNVQAYIGRTADYDKENRVSCIPSRALEILQLKGKRGQTCTECVKSGNHVIFAGEPDYQDGQTNATCGQNVSVIFFVTHFGIEVSSVVTVNGRKQSQSSMEWVQVVDYKDNTGEKLFDAPVIINLTIGGMSTYSVRNGPKAQKQSMIITAAYQPPAGTQAATKSLVPAQVLPWADFYRDCLQPNLQDILVREVEDNDGKSASLFVVPKLCEIYATERIIFKAGADVTGQYKFLPTFRFIEATSEEIRAAAEIGPAMYSDSLKALPEAEDVAFYEEPKAEEAVPVVQNAKDLLAQHLKQRNGNG